MTRHPASAASENSRHVKLSAHLYIVLVGLFKFIVLVEWLTVLQVQCLLCVIGLYIVLVGLFIALVGLFIVVLADSVAV